MCACVCVHTLWAHLLAGASVQCMALCEREGVHLWACLVGVRACVVSVGVCLGEHVRTCV